MADTRVCPLRPLRIPDRMFLRIGDTALPLHVADETNSGHGADSPSTRCRVARLAYQRPFVSELSATEGAAAVASEFIWVETTAGCIATPREARSAASILLRTLGARRVRLTNGMSMLTPVARTRDPAVGPSASSSNNHATPMPVKISPAMEFAHCQRPAPRAINNTPGIIMRSRHERLGQTTMHSRSRK